MVGSVFRISGILGALLGASLSCSRSTPPKETSIDAAPSTPSPPSALLETRPLTSLEQPENVLVWIETTPPGAAMIRVSDRFVLGHTPETIAFRRSRHPVPIRLEMKGYETETRAVPVAEDGSLSILLKAKK